MRTKHLLEIKWQGSGDEHTTPTNAKVTKVTASSPFYACKGMS